VNTLPQFTAKKSQEYPEWLIVTCPWEDCGIVFMVRRKEWFIDRKYGSNDTVITGRSCPYCFRTGRLPSRRGLR
jgi:hypothetical protein